MLSFPTDKVVVPDRLSDRIKIVLQCSPLPEEILAINGALHALDVALADDQSVNPNMRLNMYFTDRSYVQLYTSQAGLAGIQLNLAMFYIANWRTLNFDQCLRLITVIEECCHFFWTIRDEILVLDKVEDLLNILVCPSSELGQDVHQRIQGMKADRQLGYPNR